jgi:hypothetical protein
MNHHHVLYLAVLAQGNFPDQIRNQFIALNLPPPFPQVLQIAEQNPERLAMALRGKAPQSVAGLGAMMGVLSSGITNLIQALRQEGTQFLADL